MWWSAVCVKSDFIPMAWRDRGGHPALTLLALVLIFNAFGHGTALKQTRSSKSSIVLNPKLMWNIDNGKEEKSRLTGDVKYGRLILARNVQPRNESFDTNDRSEHKTKFSNGSLDNIDYQSDMDSGWVESEHVEGEVYGPASPNSPAVERLLQMEPRVECVGDSMNLKVHNTGSIPGSLFFVNRGKLQSPLPLSNLPQSCGHSMRTSSRDWTFHALYEGCYVTRENDYYIMPLLWLGLPLKMSCPAENRFKDSPPMVSCYPEGMVITISGSNAKELQIRFKGDWQSLIRVSSRCGFSVVKHPDGLVLSACYEPCVENRDGMFTLELAGKYGEIKLSCPPLPVTDDEPSEPHALPCLSERSNKPCLTTPTPGKVYQKPKPPPKAPENPSNTKPAEKPSPVTQSPWNPQHYFSFHPQPGKPVTPSPQDRVPATKSPQVPCHGPPESIKHYWNPIMPLPANQRLHASVFARPAGSPDPAANRLNAYVNRPIGF
ncbi:hypothetical protein UPYG_G00300050 [Umbra pygmaea]|uniref:Uncharacterized protein n=1 Tax=Umbra pygmaea TaxID=75934 RepID=A0ABD0W7U6_UMBPY